MMDDENPTIEHNFNHHPPSDDTVACKHSLIRDACKDLAYLLEAEIPHSRELSLAKTQLETVMFWANAGIARHCN
jgi:hypothetical protein